MWDIVVASNGTPNLLMRSLGFVVHEVMDSGQKSFKKCCQLLSGFLANDHLLRMSHQSANDKGDNEMIPRAVHRSSGILPYS